jgi:FMN phosphatase YigB (HAD superfamily)
MLSRSILPKTSWSKSIWFFDIDDTLIDTANTSIEASEGIRKVFEENFGKEKAKQTQKEFNKIFQLMLTGYRVKADSDWLNKKQKEDFEKLKQRFLTVDNQVGMIAAFYRNGEKLFVADVFDKNAVLKKY